MTKAEFIKQVATEAGTTKTDTERTVNAFGKIVADLVKNGDKVSLPNFGTFKMLIRAPRVTRNPKTNEEIRIGERRGLKFEPCKDLKNI